MTTDALEQARTAFLQGTAAFAEQRFDDAAQAFSHALALSPGRPSVVLNLGVTRLHQGQPAAALPLLEAATAALPDAADAWSALALAHHQLERWADSSRSHAHALALGADSAALRLRLAESLSRQGLGTAAIEHYEKALEADDTLVEAWSALGDVLRESGHLARAADCYQRALDLGADPALHQYYLASLRPEAALVEAPRTYVQALFDSYAHDFEDHLVGQLGYQGHRVLIEQLPPGCPGYVARVLDLGCGTGLCGPLLRPRAGHLTGVDLSPAMIDKARARGLYDELLVRDIHDHLDDGGAPYDLIVAADVFIYVGPLERAFALASRRLQPGGWLAFTVEDAAQGPGVQLLPSLRYAHREDYLQSLARNHGLAVRQMVDAPIRFHEHQPIAGRYVYIQKV
ncbi:MAG: tetratricopeptide repeat protein [Acidovorax sp.]|uniref:tetratricopeptide repeat protein n=1 Tax=Acidovorax sp. TaxID=1872122 RepID=UPI0026384794|nr:tetratricopeptide repeat protein [Acidovorax sp.]MDH4424864.1 tetratricopeptide repeat protein [Acidovorax sp.]MDH4463437.1 tetratricopeptide repeat protein [Acidovorax sp.]